MLSWAGAFKCQQVQHDWQKPLNEFLQVVKVKFRKPQRNRPSEGEPLYNPGEWDKVKCHGYPQIISVTEEFESNGLRSIHCIILLGHKR